MLACAWQGLAQEPAGNPPSTQPQVKVNMLNVCSPSAEEQKEIAGALARVPRQPLFGTDFEVSRGRSTLTDMPSFLQAGSSTHFADEKSVASYVRIRREFSVQALFSSVQYSFSNDGVNMVETLVLHVRDPKDLIQVSLEDSASSVTSSEAMLASNTPASRVRLCPHGRWSGWPRAFGGFRRRRRLGHAVGRCSRSPAARRGWWARDGSAHCGRVRGRGGGIVELAFRRRRCSPPARLSREGTDCE